MYEGIILVLTKDGTGRRVVEELKLDTEASVSALLHQASGLFDPRDCFGDSELLISIRPVK